MNYTSAMEGATKELYVIGAEALPQGGELLSSAIGGVATGIAAMWVYTYRKNSEYVGNRNDMAAILANEIRRNIQSYGLAGARPMPISPYSGIPSIDTYKGLLLSGNIRYFSNSVQGTMDKIRSCYEGGRAPDIGLHKEVLAELERIPESRDRFFVWVPHWRWWAKRWREWHDREPGQP